MRAPCPRCAGQMDAWDGPLSPPPHTASPNRGTPMIPSSEIVKSTATGYGFVCFSPTRAQGGRGQPQAAGPQRSVGRGPDLTGTRQTPRRRSRSDVARLLRLPCAPVRSGCARAGRCARAGHKLASCNRHITPACAVAKLHRRHPINTRSTRTCLALVEVRSPHPSPQTPPPDAARASAPPCTHTMYGTLPYDAHASPIPSRE